jgi:hypothetical protein
MVVHTYNPSNQEAEAGGLKVQEQPGLHSKDPSQKKKKKTKQTNKPKPKELCNNQADAQF